MRLLGLDFGGKTVGVAVSDPTGMIATDLQTIHRARENHLRGTFRAIGELLETYGVTGIVLGYPLNMDGTVGDRAEKTLAFKEALEERFKVPVFLSDERLTTFEAESLMAENGVPKDKWKEKVDAVAAAIILQEYLDSLRA